jgi:hypothetical protein
LIDWPIAGFSCSNFIYVGKPGGKRPLGRPRCTWVDNIRMDLREIAWDGVEWIGLIWLRIGISGGFHDMLGSC